MLTYFTIAITTSANAEGFTSSDTTLLSTTELIVNINQDDEFLYWTGSGDLEVEGNAPISSGDKISLEPGSYEIRLSENQEEAWDISVRHQEKEQPGRIHSYRWNIITAAFSETLYISTPLGDRSTVGVVEAGVGLLSGEITILANTDGIPAYRNLSVSQQEDTPNASLPIYLADPGLQNIGDVEKANTEASIDLNDDYSQQCGMNVIFAGVPDQVEFSITTEIDGVWQLSCDLDNDGSTDLSGYEDLVLLHQQTSGTISEAGTSTYTWDGTDADGAPLSEGEITCRVDFFQGPLHFFVGNADAASTGIRLFSRDAYDNAQESTIFWNDERVFDSKKPIDSPPVSSAPDGVSTGLPTDPIDIHANAHGWDGEDISRGSGAWIDTWTATSIKKIAEFSFTVLGTSIEEGDYDGDGLTDLIECDLQTDFMLKDTDNDGLSDGEEIGDAANPTDTDNDGDIDALDEDDDNDGIPTAEEYQAAETTYNDLDHTSDDIDGDGLLNWHDDDDDNDDISTSIEANDVAAELVSDDIDGDGLPNWYDADDDGDNIPSADEYRYAAQEYDDPDIVSDDINEDGIPNWYDDDDDGDNIPTAIEFEDGKTHTNDFDEDGLLNWYDTDSDSDRILDIDEPNDANKDEIPDYLQYNSQGGFQGGAGTCSTVPPAAALCALLPIVVVTQRRQRREQTSDDRAASR